MHVRRPGFDQFAPLARTCNFARAGPSSAYSSLLEFRTDIFGLQEVRFTEGNIYTFTGPILIAVNPFQKLPLYTNKARMISTPFNMHWIRNFSLCPGKIGVVCVDPRVVFQQRVDEEPGHGG